MSFRRWIARTFAASCAIVLGGFAAAPAFAQEAVKFPVELNRLEQAGNLCRVYLVARNPDQTAIKSFKLDLVFFDKKDIIHNRLFTEHGQLIPGKTAVRPFNMPNTDCSQLGAILVNDVATCIGEDGAPLDCLPRLELSSKADIPLRF